MDSTFKNGAWHGVIEADGQFTPEKGRYHMYIGLFCPFAHRANLIRYVKGLTEIIDISIPKAGSKGDEKGWPGWAFPTADDPYEGATEDHLFQSKYLHEVYFKDKKDYEGRFSVPVLWDKKTSRIVNNESLEILRNLNTGFNSILPEEYKNIDLYPEHLRGEIDEVGLWMQSDLNLGVYKTVLAPDQETYEKNVVTVFKALNRLEEMLSNTGGPYVLGSKLTELDLRLYPTLIRFDAAYVQIFKCNLGSIRHDYPLLNEWLKNLYWNVPGFKETTNFKHIKEGYVRNFAGKDPKGIIPMGPIPDVESDCEKDWSNIKAGGVVLPS